jgi:translation elongation factor EF-Ts
LKAQDKQHNKQIEALAQQLSLHIAAMKPLYLTESELPQEVRDQVANE